MPAERRLAASTVLSAVLSSIVSLPEPGWQEGELVILSDHVLYDDGDSYSSVLDEDDPPIDEETQALLDVRHSRSVAARVAAAWQLYDDGIYPTEEWNEVRAWLEDERDPWVRRYLILTLLDATDEEEDLLIEYLDAPDVSMRALMAWYIADSVLVDEALEQGLIEAYRSSDPWWARVPFLEALSEGSMDASLEILHDAALDPVRDIRSESVLALETRGVPGSIEYLIAALGGADLVGEDSPIEGIGRLGDISMRPIIEEAAFSESPVVRGAAARALGHLGAVEGVPALIDLLDDAERQVVVDAARALTGIGAVEAAPRILEVLLGNYDGNLFRDFVSLPGVSMPRLCAEIVLQDPSEVMLERLEAVCARSDYLEEWQRPEFDPDFEASLSIRVGHWSPHTVEFGLLDPDIRIVSPARGRLAEAWGMAPGGDHGGVRFLVEAGETITVVMGAQHGGRTWLEVESDIDSEAFDTLWIREDDVRRLDLKQALALMEERRK